jgi:cardiolipin synthase
MMDWGIRPLADQATSRAAGAALVAGNAVRLLKDAGENYPAWLEAIRSAQRWILFESYILHEDAAGREFAEVLAAKAREGVRVRLLYDWMGGLGKASAWFWGSLRSAGVDVRCFNPPRLADPLAWLRRDHRKSIVVDDRVAFVSGLCVGRMWVGEPVRGIDPWRDTGVELRGPAVAEVARAFSEVWAEAGPPLPREEGAFAPPPVAGDVALRVVADTPFHTGALRLDTLVAALARRTLWLADAYFAGSALYVQALRAAAQDDVDVRLLVPGAGSDIALVQAVSRAGYRPLLEAGVRVFEWSGPMMHAKTAVADGHWARVGSTNLNPASWLGNWELDVIVEDGRFGSAMEEMYLRDLAHSTEIVLNRRRRIERIEQTLLPPSRRAGGSASRAAAGALRIGNAIGAAFTARRPLGHEEASLAGRTGTILISLGVATALLPRLVAYPLAGLTLWLGASLLLKAYRLRRQAAGGTPPQRPSSEP